MEIKPFDLLEARMLLLPVAVDAHKGTQGHSLIIGGSHGKMGAAMLSCLGALRSGSGLVTALIPSCGYTAVQAAVPEAMVLTSGQDHIVDFAHHLQASAIGIGPGLGTHKETVAAFRKLIETCKVPVVLDEDALNILAVEPSLLELVGPNAVLTPHPGEYKRLFGIVPTVDSARALAKKYNAIIVVKGAPTHVIAPEVSFVNITGNAGLATGGSGDVLTGIITGLIAQGHAPIDAALLGVFVHGLSADIGIRKTGMRSFIARDIIENLGAAFMAVR